MNGPDEEPTEKPTNTKQEAQDEGEWMARNWIAIAAVSILALLLLVTAMMQWTGLIDVFAPIAETESQQWIGVGALALIVLIIGAWGWWSVVASTSE